MLVASPECREAEVGYWRDSIGIQNDILFAENVDTALMNVSTGAGFLPCDYDVPSLSGPPLTRKMYAFWPEQAQ